MRRTKIVCTLGPTSNDAETIGALIEAGMNVVRLNFSHGDHESHRARFALVRKVAAEHNVPIPILQDLQGPKIRVGKVPGGEMILERGKQVTIVTNGGRDGDAAGDVIPCTYKPLAQDVSKGDRILLDDGRLELRVLRTGDHFVACEVIVGGALTNNKGINLPGVKLSTPALTDKDKRDIKLGLELGVDAVALSFVLSAEDCRQARELIGNVPLIAKIERPHALDHIDEILDVVDGTMVARGDLGVELGVEQVPMAQKTLIEQTNARGKLVITATEMLDSMRHSPRPTRAEASDVANAVLDGTDCVMLSGETAAGDYPVQSVETMDRILRVTEESPRYQGLPDVPSLDYPEITHAVARASVVAAREVRAKTIICFTETGKSAVLISEYRPKADIVAVSVDERLYRRLALQWGVTPLYLEDRSAQTVDEAIAAITELAVSSGKAQRGDLAVVTAGSWTGGASDLLKIHRL
ncbi:MAG: pyruvate kinase [Myxococcales bacterium]|nr:pyruvate kinase [Myxococcales bacterium]